MSALAKHAPGEIVHEPSAWVAADIPADRSWVMPFEPDMLEEIRATAETMVASGRTPTEIRREDVPLPKTEPLLSAAYGELETGRGFAMLSGFPVDDWEEDILEAAYCAVGSHLGRITIQNREGEYLLHVTDLGKEYSTQSRGYHSTADLHFHNDGTNTVALLCAEVAAKGGKSKLISSVAVYNEIVRTRPDLLAPLLNGFQHHRRDQHEPGDSPLTPFRVPVFSFLDDVFHCCYTRFSIDITAEEGVELTEHELAALDYLDAVIDRPDFQLALDFHKGDIQLVNNFVLLHARSDYVDHPDRKRHLLRLWLDDERSRFNGPNKMDFYVPEASRFLMTRGYESVQ